MDCLSITHGLWPGRFGCGALVAATILWGAGAAQGQTPATAGTRAGRVAVEQQEKAKNLKPHAPNKAEVLLAKVEEQFITGSLHWHPFFQSAYAGGGFTLGAGYLTHVGATTRSTCAAATPFPVTPGLRPSSAPRACSTAAACSRSSAAGARPRRSASTGSGPATRRGRPRQLRLPAAVRVGAPRRTADAAAAVPGRAASSTRSGTRAPAQGSAPSVEEVYTPATLPGLGASPPTCTRWAPRPSTGALLPATRGSGGYYGVTVHDFADRDDTYSFRQVDYEAIQHIPLLRDAGCCRFVGGSRRPTRPTTRPCRSSCCRRSAAARACAASRAGVSAIATACSLQAEWRVLVEQLLRHGHLRRCRQGDRPPLGPRLRRISRATTGSGSASTGPAATPMRIELAKSNEGLAIVFSAKAAF